MGSLARRLSVVAVVCAALSAGAAAPAVAAPRFQMPFGCGEYWRVSTSASHRPNRLAVDMNVGFRNHDLGKVVRASAPGRAYRGKNSYRSYGRYVVINHGGGWTTIYAHLASYGVRNGARVKQGDAIGWVGNNKGRFTAHLHYEQRYRNRLKPVRFNGTRVALRNFPRSVTKTSSNCPNGRPRPAPVPSVATPSIAPAATALEARPAASQAVPLLPIALLLGGSVGAATIPFVRRDATNR